MRNKWLPGLILASALLVCLPAVAVDTLDKKLSIPGVANEKWTKNFEGYGRKTPVTQVGDWILFAVDATWNNQPTILVRRITLLEMKSGEHSIKVEDCYQMQQDKNIVQDMKIKPYEFPLGWEYPTRAAQNKIKEPGKVTVAGKELDVRIERIFYKDSAENYFHEICFWEDKLPFGAPVKRIRTGVFEKNGEPKANNALKTQIFRVLDSGSAANRGPFEPKKYFPPETLPIKFNAKPNDWIAVGTFSGTMAKPILLDVSIITYDGVKEKIHTFTVEKENRPPQLIGPRNPEDVFSVFWNSPAITWAMEVGSDQIQIPYSQKIEAVKYLAAGAGVMMDVWIDNNIAFGFPAVVEYHAGHAQIANAQSGLILLAASKNPGQEKPKFVSLREQWMKKYPPKDNKKDNTKTGI